MAEPKTEPPRGVLHPKANQEKFQLSRFLPGRDLDFFVEHYWIVAWDLRGREPYLAETLPHPSVHLVFEPDRSYIQGVMRHKFSYLLQGQGQVFGIKFRPGAFYPFFKSPVSRLTDRSPALTTVFGPAGETLAAAIRPVEDKEKQVELAEDFLAGRLPERDENIEWVNRIAAWISANRDITRVDQVVDRLDLSKRTLQRLFSRYVGVSPKWVIQRYRLHDAAEQLAGGQVLDLAALAVDLGYFDQAHFIKDFKAIIGKSPLAYTQGQ